jgi:hypothetical protein
VLAPSRSRRRRMQIRTLLFVLCVLQPAARLWGRLHRGLTPWRNRGPRVLGLPRHRRTSVWSERWCPAERWVERLHAALQTDGAQVVRGDDFDTWDLEVRVGPLAASRVRVAVEEHGRGRQLVRLRIRPRWSLHATATGVALLGLLASAVARSALVATCLLAVLFVWLLAGMALQAAAAVVLPSRVAARLEDA